MSETLIELNDMKNYNEQHLISKIKTENSPEESHRVMDLDNIFFKDPLVVAACLLQQTLITGHNLKVALLTLINILSAKLKMPMGLMLAASDLSVGMKILKQCMSLAPEDAYKECGRFKQEELFGNAPGLNGKSIISTEQLGFEKTWVHMEKMLTMGYASHTEIIKSKYNTVVCDHRVESLVSVIGIIADMREKAYNHPSVLKLPLNVEEYPLSQLSSHQEAQPVDISTEVDMVRLRETLARLRPLAVDIPFLAMLENTIKTSNASDPGRKLEIILKVLTICCIINHPEPVYPDEIRARIYKMDIHMLRQIKASSTTSQYVPETLPILKATKKDYYHTWLLLNDMIPVKEISLSDRQIQVFQAIKQINLGKLGSSFTPDNIIKQLSQISTSPAYWARRENIFESLNRNGREEISQSTLYLELQHLIKEGLVAEGKYPKSSQKGYFVTTFEAGKKIQLPHPAEIFDNTFKGEKTEVVNFLTGEVETI